jgi:hypothetical protein
MLKSYVYLISPTTSFLITRGRRYLVLTHLLLFCCISHCVGTWEKNSMKRAENAVYKRMILLKASMKFNVPSFLSKGYTNRKGADVKELK